MWPFIVDSPSFSFAGGLQSYEKFFYFNGLMFISGLGNR